MSRSVLPPKRWAEVPTGRAAPSAVGHGICGLLVERTRPLGMLDDQGCSALLRRRPVPRGEDHHETRGEMGKTTEQAPDAVVKHRASPSFGARMVQERNTTTDREERNTPIILPGVWMNLEYSQPPKSGWRVEVANCSPIGNPVPTRSSRSGWNEFLVPAMSDVKDLKRTRNLQQPFPVTWCPDPPPTRHVFRCFGEVAFGGPKPHGGVFGHSCDA